MDHADELDRVMSVIGKNQMCWVYCFITRWRLNFEAFSAEFLSFNLANIFEYFLDSFHLRRGLAHTQTWTFIKSSISFWSQIFPEYSSLVQLGNFRRPTMSNRSKALHKLCSEIYREFIDFPGLSEVSYFYLHFRTTWGHNGYQSAKCA